VESIAKQGNNGLGDQKDADNTIKGTDASNPGHDKVNENKAQK
jgi:hypothetical protein